VHQFETALESTLTSLGASASAVVASATPNGGSLTMSEHGTFIWNELVTEDLATCGSFYSDVFG
jgi:hypothetical protein